MTKKKILIVSRSFYPQNSPRSFRTTELAKEFARQGHEVTVLTPKNLEVHPTFEKEHGLTIKDLGQPKGKSKAFFEAEKNGILVNELVNIPFAGRVIKNQKPGFENLLKKVLPDFVIKFLLRISKRKLKLNEGLNQIYALKAKSVKEILDPINDFPDQTLPYIKEHLSRYPYQMDYHFLTALYTLRNIAFDKRTNK